MIIICFLLILSASDLILGDKSIVDPLNDSASEKEMFSSSTDYEKRKTIFDEILKESIKILFDADEINKTTKINDLKNKLENKVKLPLLVRLKKERDRLQRNLNGKHDIIDGTIVGTYAILLDGIAVLDAQLKQPDALFLEKEDLNSLNSLGKKIYTEGLWKNIKLENRITGYEQSKLSRRFSLILFSINTMSRIHSNEIYDQKLSRFYEIIEVSRKLLFKEEMNTDERKDKIVAVQKELNQDVIIPIVLLLQKERDGLQANLNHTHNIDGINMRTYAMLLDSAAILDAQLKQPEELFLEKKDLNSPNSLRKKAYIEGLWENIRLENRIMGYEEKKLPQDFSLRLFSINTMSRIDQLKQSNKIYDQKLIRFYEIIDTSRKLLFEEGLNTDERKEKIAAIQKELNQDIMIPIVSLLQKERDRLQTNLNHTHNIDGINVDTYARLLDSAAILDAQLKQPEELFLEKKDLNSPRSLSEKAYIEGLWKNIRLENSIIGYEQAILPKPFSLFLFSINIITSKHRRLDKLYDQKLLRFSEILKASQALLYRKRLSRDEKLKEATDRIEELSQDVILPLVESLQKKRNDIQRTLKVSDRIDDKRVGAYASLLDGAAILDAQLKQPEELFLQEEDLNSLRSLGKKIYIEELWENIRPENRIIGYEKVKLSEHFSLKSFSINAISFRYGQQLRKESNKIYDQKLSRFYEIIGVSRKLLFEEEMNTDERKDKIAAIQKELNQDLIIPLVELLQGERNRLQANLKHTYKIDGYYVQTYATLLDGAVILDIQLKQPEELFLEKKDLNSPNSLRKKAYIEGLWENIRLENRIMGYEEKKLPQYFSLRLFFNNNTFRYRRSKAIDLLKALKKLNIENKFIFDTTSTEATTREMNAIDERLSVETELQKIVEIQKELQQMVKKLDRKIRALESRKRREEIILDDPSRINKIPLENASIEMINDFDKKDPCQKNLDSLVQKNLDSLVQKNNKKAND